MLSGAQLTSVIGDRAQSSSKSFLAASIVPSGHGIVIAARALPAAASVVQTLSPGS